MKQRLQQCYIEQYWKVIEHVRSRLVDLRNMRGVQRQEVARCIGISKSALDKILSPQSEYICDGTVLVALWNYCVEAPF